MPEYEQAADLQEIAQGLVRRIENIEHVDVNEVLFLREHETRPKALAKCFKFGNHPVAFFTDKKYCIVVYQANCDYLSREQLIVLVLHEMMHIPAYGNKLIDHDVQDFRAILGVDIDWTEPGKEIPDLLKDNGKRGKKSDNGRSGLHADEARGTVA